MKRPQLIRGSVRVRSAVLDGGHLGIDDAIARMGVVSSLRWWPSRNAWRRRASEGWKVASYALVRRTVWTGPVIFAGFAPVAIAQAMIDPSPMRLQVAGVFALILIGIVTALDARIARRDRWRDALDELELEELLAGFQPTDVDDLPRDLASMPIFEGRVAGESPEALSAYVSQDSRTYLMLTAVRKGRPRWDLICGRNIGVQERSFRVAAVSSLLIRKKAHLTPRFDIEITTGDVPKRLTEWLEDQRPFVEIVVRGAWTTCRSVDPNAPPNSFSGAPMPVTHALLRTVLVTSDAVRKTVQR